MMKVKIIALPLFVFFGFISLMGQEPIKVNIEQRPSSFGIHPAFEVVVPQATSRDAIDLWENTITPGKLFKKTPKMEKVEDEWLVNEVEIEDISSFPLDVITQVSSYPGHIYVRIFLKGDNGFLGIDNVPATRAAQEYIRNYGVELYRLTVEKELKEEEKTFKNLQNDLKKLKKQNDNYDDRIADARQEQNDLDKEAEYNRQLIEEGLNVTEESKKDLEGQLKSNEKELKRAGNAESRLSDRAKKNEMEQRDKVREIEKQEQKVKQVKNKLNNIR